MYSKVLNEEDGKNGSSCNCLICLDSKYEVRIKEEAKKEESANVVTDQPAPPLFAAEAKERHSEILPRSAFFREIELP